MISWLYICINKHPMKCPLECRHQYKCLYYLCLPAYRLLLCWIMLSLNPLCFVYACHLAAPQMTDRTSSLWIITEKNKTSQRVPPPRGYSTVALTHSFVILTAIDTDVWINDMFPLNIMPSIKPIWDTESTCHFETREQTRFIQQTSVTHKTAAETGRT